MMSMSVEKSYRLVGRELSIEYSPLESGLDRFVHPNKGEFLGRDALVRWREKGFANRFVTMEVAWRHRCRRARLRADPGRTASSSAAPPSAALAGGVGKSLALGMVRPDLGEIGTELDITILGKPHRATVIEESPFDAANERLRA